MHLIESAVVMRRQKQMTSDDEDRPMRRVSYLRATANENSLQLQHDSDMDNSPMSAPADTPDNDIPLTQLLKRFVQYQSIPFFIYMSNHIYFKVIYYISPQNTYLHQFVNKQKKNKIDKFKNKVPIVHGVDRS